MKLLIRNLAVITLFGVSSLSSTPAAAHDDGFPLNLLFSHDDVPQIRENTKLPMFREYWDSLLKADFSEDGNFLREAFIYAITEDPRRGENARQGMLDTLERERWDMFLEDGSIPLGFLTGGRLTAWMSLSYDWIYNLLSEAEREAVLVQIADKGCAPCYRALHGMRYPDTVKGWGFDDEYRKKYDVRDMTRWPVILGHNNFRAVISGGFALGLFAVEGRDPRFAEWKEMLLDSFDRIEPLYKPDGSYDEGIAYANYANTYIVYLVEAMKRKAGIDLFDAANFVGMMDCNLSLFFPHHLDPSGSVNFGDAGRSMNSSNLLWVAKNSRDGLTQYQALNLATNHDLFSLVHYDPSVMAVPPVRRPDFRELDIGWIVTRTGYAMDDLVVAMRSGPPANHEHGDRNSVILKYGGEILFADSKRPTYDYRNPGWLLRTSPAHNTVLIDNEGHQYHNGEEGTNESKASAQIIRKGERPGYVYWTSDATPAYSLVNDDVRSVIRTVLVFREIPFLIVVDKLKKHARPSRFSARWFVENSDKSGTIESNGDRFTITRPHARFVGTCAGDQGVTMQVAKLPLEESVGIFPYLDVSTSKAASDAILITAGSPVKRSEADPNIKIERAGDTWTIEARKGSSELQLRIFDRENVPGFEVVKLAL